MLFAFSRLTSTLTSFSWTSRCPNVLFLLSLSFTDLLLQILNGFEAAAGIRALEAASDVPLCDQRPSTILNGRIPILAVSASLHERAKHTIEEVGIDGWILKPVDFRRLASLMRGAIDREKRWEEVYRCVSRVRVMGRELIADMLQTWWMGEGRMARGGGLRCCRGTRCWGFL